MKFRLTSKHYAFDREIPEDTLIGDGTGYPMSGFGGPSIHMEPLDDEARAAYDKMMAKYAGRRVPIEILGAPPTTLKEGQRIGIEPPKPGSQSGPPAPVPTPVPPAPPNPLAGIIQVKGD